MYGKAVITLKDGTTKTFAANDENAIAEFLYENAGNRVEKSNGIPTYIEASSWCPLASIGETFDSSDFVIEIAE